MARVAVDLLGGDAGAPVVADAIAAVLAGDSDGRDTDSTPPSIQICVVGPEDLARELLAERLSEAAQGVAGEDAVRALGDAWRSVVRDAPGLYAATDRYPCAGDDELEAAVERVVNVIARSLAGFDLDDAQRIHVARALRSAFHGFAHLESGDGHPHPHDLEVSFTGLVDLLMAGIRHLERTGESR
ncbi:MAG: WHG domain-containing protein [Actinobacteria bacterium]|nr:WHG domain-containing protein [Actinomycetota bacterium]